jgi:hypothetical protein
MHIATHQGLLGRLWEGWKRLGRRIGDVQARILLTVFYFLAVPPFALLVKRADPLALKASTAKGWRPRAELPGPALDNARRQF